MTEARATVSTAITTGQMTLSITEKSISGHRKAVDAQLILISGVHRSAADADADTPRVTLAATDSSCCRIDQGCDPLPISLLSPSTRSFLGLGVYERERFSHLRSI
ncbi:hypothetical protein M5K25_011078 [Dendrobium thyrsiflorum]|uniref:Uncharacterized protein n=1 Tax=Dendrobium thyrsiflorum TaxID=117978 RepID=A0ABD0V2X2_DENTH